MKIKLLNWLKRWARRFNEYQPLMITIAVTLLAAVLYHFSPAWFARVDSNPYVPYYNSSEFHDIVRRSLKLFAYTGVVIITMRMLFPGSWNRLENMLRNKGEDNTTWLRETFTFLLFLGLLFALVLS